MAKNVQEPKPDTRPSSPWMSRPAHWSGGQAASKRLQRGRLIVDGGSSYYAHGGGRRFYMSKTLKTGALRNPYYGKTPPWEFPTFIECIE